MLQTINFNYSLVDKVWDHTTKWHTNGCWNFNQNNFNRDNNSYVVQELNQNGGSTE